MILISKKTVCLLSGITLSAASCAPKAEVVEQVVTPPAEVKREVKPVEVEVPPPTMPDDLRMGDMLGMPNDSDFRATNPGAVRPPAGEGAVISRPPTEPPARVKPGVEGEQ